MGVKTLNRITKDEVRVFNGIIYSRFSKTITKSKAKRLVKIYRQDGYLARTVAVPDGYAVFLGSRLRRDAPKTYEELRRRHGGR